MASTAPIGHAAHTKDAQHTGLPGTMPRPIRLVFLGAGSNFTPRLLNDVLRISGSTGGTFCLVDIDADRLATMQQLISRLVDQLAPGAWQVTATTDRREALPGAHYVVNCIESGGPDCVDAEYEIPHKYGIDQCIGDTVGPGGLFKALRTGPVWLAILRDCEELCPDALVLNYTNPMGILCLAAARSSSMAVVGLCHSVQGTSTLLSEYAGVPLAEMEWDCAGINHLAWFTKLRHDGEDLYPRLHDKFAREIAAGIREYDEGKARSDSANHGFGAVADIAYEQTDLVRKDMCNHFGAFITESSGHLSEYLPYYRKSEAGRKLLRLAFDGGSRFYATNWPLWRETANAERQAMLDGTHSMDWERSWEYASWIIEAREKDSPYRIHGNVANRRDDGSLLITNLPADGCVEVACTIDRHGITPQPYGVLPPQMAAICASNMGMIGLAAQAVIERSKEAAIHALMLDPLTSALCTPAEIAAMTRELFAAEADRLCEYR